MIAPYLTPTGAIVSMQNGMNEDAVAAVVGADRTLGVVLNTIGVNNVGPGIVTRTTRPGGAAHFVFRVGELDGRKTWCHRHRHVAEFGRQRDSHGQSARRTLVKLVTNFDLARPVGRHRPGQLWPAQFACARRIIVRLAAEGVAVGDALGYRAGRHLRHGAGNLDSRRRGRCGGLATVEHSLLRRLAAPGRRRTPLARARHAAWTAHGNRFYIRGLIVARGEQQAIATPMQAAVLEVVQQVERGDTVAGPETLEATP